MKRINMIAILACLAVSCVPSSETQADVLAVAEPLVPTTSDATVPVAVQDESLAVVLAEAAVAESADMGNPEAERFLELQQIWPSGEELKDEAEGFMDTGFMKNPSQFGFADLAYSDIALDCSINDQSRISEIRGVLSEMYDSYSFTIPVVQRMVDAISGSRQVNWEDVIVKLDETRWQVQPVALRGIPSFEIHIDSSIELIAGDTLSRLVKNGSVFTYSEYTRRADGQEELRISWKVNQYERGPVYDIQFLGGPGLLVPVIMAWDPGFLTGYLVSLPEGQPVFIQRLRWESTGELETDRYNFLVLLTQRHGGHLAIPDRLGVIDPVWLSLLLYDHVVNP